MGNILLPSHKPLRISVPKFDDPKVETWAKELESQLNRVLIWGIEDERQRIEFGLSDGTKDLTVGNLSLPQCSRVQARRTTTQSLTNADWTDFVFTTEDKDTRGEYNTTTGVFTATEAGSYAVAWLIVSSSVAWDAGEIFQSGLSVNNSVAAGGIYYGPLVEAHAAGTFYMSSNGSAVVYLSANDTLRIKVYHNQGAAITSAANASYLHIHKIS